MPAAVKRWIDGEFPQCVPAKALLSPLWQQLMPDKQVGNFWFKWQQIWLVIKPRCVWKVWKRGFGSKPLLWCWHLVTAWRQKMLLFQYCCLKGTDVDIISDRLQSGTLCSLSLLQFLMQIYSMLLELSRTRLNSFWDHCLCEAIVLQPRKLALRGIVACWLCLRNCPYDKAKTKYKRGFSLFLIHVHAGFFWISFARLPNLRETKHQWIVESWCSRSFCLAGTVPILPSRPSGIKPQVCGG